MKAYGRMEVHLHTFLTSALHEGELSASSPGPLLSALTEYKLSRGNSLAVAGNRTTSSRPPAGSYTECTVPVYYVSFNETNFSATYVKAAGCDGGF